MNVTLKDFEVPNCKFLGRYESGLYTRNPHCCCELVWRLKQRDYKVNKATLDKNCPLRILAGANYE